MKILLALIFCVSSFTFLFSSLYACLNLPEMKFSYSQNKCVSISESGKLKNCAKIPSKYFITYVR